MTNPAGAAVAAPSATFRPSPAHLAFVVGSFLAAFLLCGLVLDHCLPFPNVPEVGARLHYFAERKDDFDTIFIGSSRVRHQVIPLNFDRETAGLGAATRSFNLGYSGMWPPESFYFLRQVLALHPQRLRWVIIELMDYRFGQVEGQAPTIRSVYWHDAPHTGMALRIVWESHLPLIEKPALLAAHLFLYVERLAHPGRGAEWLQERYFRVRNKSDTGWMERAGFDPEEESQWTDSAKADFARKIVAFEQAKGQEQMRPGFAADLQDLIADVQRAGAEPIFLLPPTVRAEEHFAAGLPAGMTIWEFDDPAQYPRLYLPELHYDSGHLNEAGAREFTELLARRFVEMVQKHQAE